MSSPSPDPSREFDDLSVSERSPVDSLTTGALALSPSTSNPSSEEALKYKDERSFFLCRERRDGYQVPDGNGLSIRMLDAIKDAWSTQPPDTHPMDWSKALEQCSEDLWDFRDTLNRDENTPLTRTVDRLIHMINYTLDKLDTAIARAHSHGGSTKFIKPTPFQRRRFWARDRTDIFDFVETLRMTQDQPTQNLLAKTFSYLHNAFLHSKAHETVSDLIEDDYNSIQRSIASTGWSDGTEACAEEESDAGADLVRDLDMRLVTSRANLAGLERKGCHLGQFAVEVDERVDESPGVGVSE